MDVPEGFEELTTVKSIDDLGANSVPDEIMGEKSNTTGMHVMGKTLDKYAITMHHRGDPVVLVDKSLVSEFDEGKFNWRPVER